MVRGNAWHVKGGTNSVPHTGHGWNATESHGNLMRKVYRYVLHVVTNPQAVDVQKPLTDWYVRPKNYIGHQETLTTLTLASSRQPKQS